MRKQPNETPEQFAERLAAKTEAVKAKREQSTNPKKNPKARREKNPLGVFVPYMLLNLKRFRTNQKQRQAINRDLFKRAQFARRRGYYPEV